MKYTIMELVKAYLKGIINAIKRLCLYSIFLTGLCMRNDVKAAAIIPARDTSGQTKLNALTNRDRASYSLTITPGKTVKANCDPHQFIYNLIATLKNNSNDTLKYIDWTSDASIWYFNNNDLYVIPSYLSPCASTIDHNFIMYYTVFPHQSAKIELSVLLKQGVNPINKKFKIGMILQRVFKKKDFEFYSRYFMTHELGNQTINLIWSNAIIMSK